jgi:acyl carrier protein
MSIDTIRELIVQIGLEHVELEPDSRLRADLGLDSGETTALESQLRARLGATVDLWAEHDYSLAELADLVNRMR